MQCAFCEASLAPGAQYCPQCGTVAGPNPTGFAPASAYTTYPPVQSPTSSLAIASMISGILGWTVFPIVAAIIAIVTGHMARSEIRNSGGRVGGDGMALFGLIAGYAQMVLAVLFLLVVLAVVGFGLYAAARSGG
jgi:hypothetical protein